MGIGNALRLWGGQQVLAGLPLNPQPQVEAWTTSQLTSIVWADILGLDTMPVTRAEAMMVPAVARAAALLKATIAKWPLQAWRTDTLVDPQPSWCLRSDGVQSWQWRTAWTVDDLIFFGASLWILDRGADGFPLAASRVPWADWDVNFAGEIVDLDSRPYPPGRVALIPGWHEGIVNFGQRALRTAAALEQSALGAANAPFRLELHQLTDAELTPDEKQAFVAEARSALLDHAGILFTNAAIEARDHGGAAEQLVIEARNAAAVDMARLIGVPAAMIDATSAGASLTYETIGGRNQQFLDYGTSLYADPIAARLSLDDIVPAGQRAAFDTSASTESVVPAGGTPVED